MWHAANGITGGNSLSTPSSRLSRLVDYLHFHGTATRKELCYALGMPMQCSSYSWSSGFFSALVHNGYLIKDRGRRTPLYRLGPMITGLGGNS